METMHIDLAGPNEASMSGSHCLIMFVAVDEAVRHEDKAGDNRVRPEVPGRHQRHEATTLLSDGQRWGVHRPQLHRTLRCYWDST